ncbi:YciI family protein [Acidovorax sp. Root70]|uniref:YciI family protein n=1 Tax=Acidovorax sp. Root70 TaxID=1736590 RepID=UPI0006F5FDBA|nr:YciI family protein [Acidovorax sp. Root70]KRB30463.1 hypothetical protein ASD94_04590 [Acidovorax sp. Root70]
MLYLVTLRYIRPVEEVHVHLDTHRDWLVEHTGAGRILVAGPLEDRTGGLVLARCENREALDQMLAQDSFAQHRLVEHAVLGFGAALRAGVFPADWAPEAKVVA